MPSLKVCSVQASEDFSGREYSSSISIHIVGRKWEQRLVSQL